MDKKIKSVVSIMKSKRISTVAGAWVFYFLTGLLPLTFLLITAFSIFKIQLSAEVVGRLPEEFRLAGETILTSAEKSSKSATFFFIITIFFSGSTLLNQMSKDGEYIYGIKLKGKRGVFRRLWAIFALLVLFVVFIFIAFLFAFRNSFAIKFASGKFRTYLLTFLFFLTITLSCYFIIILLSSFISPVRLKISTLLTGSLVSLSIIVLGTIAFIIYIRFFHSYNAFYGSLAGIIVFILWAYILMLGLVIGTAVNSKLNKDGK